MIELFPDFLRMKVHNPGIDYILEHASSGVGIEPEPGKLGAGPLGVLKGKKEDLLW